MPATPAPERPREDRQEMADARILAATRAVLEQDGIRGARMGRIAVAAGCSRATLYRYFSNKEALLHAYMVNIAKGFLAVIGERLRELDKFEDRLIEAAATSVELMQSREDVAPFFTEEGVGLTAQLTASAEAMRDQVATQLDRESSSEKIVGKLREDVTAAQAAEWVTRVIFSLATVPMTSRTGAELRAYLRQMLAPALLAH